MKIVKVLVTILFFFAAFAFFATRSPQILAQTGGVVDVPTGVSASTGSYTTKIGINWDPIRGATLYRVFRASTDNQFAAVEIGSTAAPYFFDRTAAQNTTFFYWIRAENSTAVSPLTNSVPGLRANGTPNGPISPLEPPNAPAGNPVTAAKTALGKVLFWEEQLSSTRTVACGTCHINGASGSDPRSVINDVSSTNPGIDGVFGTADDVVGSPGVPLSDTAGNYLFSTAAGIRAQVTNRRSMPAINAGYSPLLFWDGRASQIFRDPITNSILLNSNAALESQAAGPPLSNVEMAHTGRDWAVTTSQIRNAKPLSLAGNIPTPLATWIGGRNYPQMFLEAFGTTDVTAARIAMAIATYERTLFSDRTPFDLFVGGSNSLTAAEQRGRTVYNTTNCNLCHGGSLLTNDAFIYTGVRPVNDDLGRFNETGLNPDRGSFKVPGLRNIEHRAPYMHNGRFATLEDVVAFYNRGGDFNAPNKAPAMQPLGLSAAQMADLVAFLRRPLTDPRVTNQTGPFDQPTLYTQSNRVPLVSGSGRSGTGGMAPQIVAIEPPIVGNPGFTVAISNSVPSAQAVLVINSTDPGIGTVIPSSGSFTRQTVTLASNGLGIGYGSVKLAIPDTQAFVGQALFARWYVPDGNAANGFAVSPLVSFTIFGQATSSTNVSISGQVFTSDGRGLRNAVVSIFDSAGVRLTATTSSFGFYSFETIRSGESYTMSVASKRYRFAAQVIDVSSNLTSMNFVGLE